MGIPHPVNSPDCFGQENRNVLSSARRSQNTPELEESAALMNYVFSTHTWMRSVISQALIPTPVGATSSWLV